MTTPLPDWTRMAWIDRTTRAWWSAIRQEWIAIWAALERESVGRFREAGLVYVQPDELAALTTWAARRGLVVAPVEQSSMPSDYSATHTPLQPGAPWQYRVMLAAPAVLQPALDAYARHDHEALGALLGYPPCCRAAFAATWGQGQVDSTWDAGAEGPADTNLWLRWFGVRLVAHLPCRQTCEASLAVAHQFAELAIARGARWQLQAAREMLAWPMAWSRLHGVAWVTTPALRISTRTDYTAGKDEMRRLGGYQSPAKTLWTDNGFSSPGPMLAAHGAIVAALEGQVRPDQTVVDLGAGNGLLLRRLEGCLAIRPVGVELSPEVSTRRVCGGEWFEGNLADVPWDDTHPDVVLLMPGRLLELSPEKADAVRAACHRVPRVLVYAYSDNLGPDGLAGLAARAGLSGPLLTLTDGPQHAIGLLAQSHEDRHG